MDEKLLERMKRMDVELKKLEEALLQERIEAEYHGDEVTPELRQKLLEEIREKCRVYVEAEIRKSNF